MNPKLTWELTWEIRDEALRLGMARSGSMGHRDTVHSRSMMEDRPNYWRHYIGALGEIIFSLYSGLQVDSTTIGRGDDGSDFPGGINVKSSDHPNAPNLLILKSLWERKHAKIYALVWIDEPQAHIMGAITSERAFEVKKLKEFGHGPTYWIDRGLLVPVHQLIPPAAANTRKKHLPAGCSGPVTAAVMEQTRLAARPCRATPAEPF